MDREEMDTVANIGLVEDIMSAVSTLPGVGFTGGWNSQPSIRGGYPEEMGTVMDGVYLAYPWHWGGAFSIFNPYMVSSAKMSNGVFSARYGRAMSGLLEVTTLTPEPGQVRVEGGISTLSTDAFAQIPFSDKAGLVITSYSIHYTKLYEKRRGYGARGLPHDQRLYRHRRAGGPVPRYRRGFCCPRPLLCRRVRRRFAATGARGA